MNSPTAFDLSVIPLLNNGSSTICRESVVGDVDRVSGRM